MSGKVIFDCLVLLLACVRADRSADYVTCLPRLLIKTRGNRWYTQKLQNYCENERKKEISEELCSFLKDAES